jgi:hypothetical protein
MRIIRYPLKEGNIEDATAKAVSEAIKGPIDALSRGASPPLLRGQRQDLVAKIEAFVAAYNAKARTFV